MHLKYKYNLFTTEHSQIKLQFRQTDFYFLNIGTSFTRIISEHRIHQNYGYFYSNEPLRLNHQLTPSNQFLLFVITEELYTLLMFSKFIIFHVYKLTKSEIRPCAIPRVSILKYWSTSQQAVVEYPKLKLAKSPSSPYVK